MEQKQRDRIAWGLAIILGPIFIYFLATNVFRVGRRPTPAPEFVAAGVAAPRDARSLPASLPRAAVVPESLLDPGIADEQYKIAMRLPRRNPFGVSRQLSQTGPAASSARSGETAIRVTGIASRSGSKRMAMVNGKLLSEGDRINEWTILKVNQQNVILDNGTRQIVVRVK
ncbi:MAG: general secretion pathway protein GspB [Verrucomicrobia bacterium]|nr:general secretion pathway protein GspB [Verrucomicrobiota bacterium]MBU4247177.1 general secretion pathway protein GspB [Verrucomicrobiota bacterium]MBU4291241.1 general secretion pathway protein GspB [Verrucomicrobiota bacterium]MCG2678692.1 general secretion pathway protein GspB [Kiritimatiellia bacterium]